MERNLFFERRMQNSSTKFSDRRSKLRRSNQDTNVAPERRRLVSQARYQSRAPFQIPVRLKVERNRIFGHSLNISSGGLQINSAIPLDKGTPLNAQLSFGGNGCSVCFRGSVAYCRPTANHSIYLIGIEFSNDSEGDREFLDWAVSQFAEKGELLDKSLITISLVQQVERMEEPTSRHAEKFREGLNECRTYPRVDCRIALTVDNTFLGTIENIGLEGLYVSSDHIMTIGEELNFEFYITENAKRVRGSFEVVRTAGKGRGGYGVKFRKMAPKDRGLLKQYFFARVSDAVHTRAQKQYQETPDRMVRMSNEGHIRTLFSEAMSKEVTLTTIEELTGASYRAVISDVGKQHLGIKLDPPKVGLEKGVKIVVFFSHQWESYSFQTEILEVVSDLVVLQMPESIFCSDRRTHPREGQPVSGKWVRVEWPTPENKIERVVGVLIDESPSGLSFIAPVEWNEVSSFDSCLGNVEVITADQQVKKEHVVVKHVTRIDSSGRLLKIGIEFNIPRKDFSFAVEDFSRYRQSKEVSANLSVPDLLSVARVVRYQNASGEEIVALVNSTCQDDKKILAPVVVIPPAYGRRKESTCALALTIVENFKKHGKDIVVIRFDYTGALGESFNDVDEPREGREYLNVQYSRYVEDIRATIRFAKDNTWFSASQIVLTSFSFSGPMARRVVAEDYEGLITHWISPFGAPDAQELVKNSGGGVDYLGNFEKGIRSGIVNFLGSLVDMDQFCNDAIRHKLAFMNDARREMATIKIPVTWIFGTHDAWINPRKIHDLMSVSAPGPRKVIEIPTGHMGATSEEALNTFQLITECIWERLHPGVIQAVSPPANLIRKANRAEWDRTGKTSLGNRQTYWKKYLLGERAGEIGFDVLMKAAEYRELLDDEMELLGISEHSVIADMGSGTGNALQAILERTIGQGVGRLEGVSIVAVDLVHDALIHSRGKCLEQLRERSLNRAIPSAVTADLEIGRIQPFKRLANWGPTDRIEEVLSCIEGVDLVTIEKIAASFDSHLRSILSGDLPVEENVEYLQARFNNREIEIISEIHSISCLLIKRDDTAGKRLRILKPISPSSDFSLPFKSEVFDGILSSLVLSYIFNQQELVAEFYRCLKPNGRLVVSSMLPDTDISKVYMGMIDNIIGSKDLDGPTRETLLRSARDFASSASILIRLEEEGRFRFFSGDELAGCLQSSGFKHIRIDKSWGKPARAVIVSGEK